MLNGFQDRRIQPLCHLSVTGNDSIESMNGSVGGTQKAGRVMQRLEHDDERFMREALAEAHQAAAEGEVPIGAVVVYDEEIIARAHNRRELDEDPSAHAEFAAMTAAARALGRWRLTGCTVYVTLEPCLMCAGLMVNARIDRCVYGAADPKGGAVGTLYDVSCDTRLNHAFEVTSGVLADECAAELSMFFAKLRGKSAGARDDKPPAEARPTGIGNLPPAPQILLAVDSFKGSATSIQAEAWLEEGIRRCMPDAEIARIPIADGGEGTLDAIRTARGGELRATKIRNAMGEPATANYLLIRKDAIAVIEMAQAAGITQSPCTHEAALSATTHGVGELILDAVGNGARTVYVGLGGSATSDGGAGMLQALGARLLDATGAPIRPGIIGLRDLTSIDLSPARRALDGIELVALTDVSNLLIGPRGAVHVFGPQKGLGSNLSEAERIAAPDTCDTWMRAYAARLTDARNALDGTPLQVATPGSRPRSLAGVPGAGAAGGLGAALLALGARLTSGIDTMLDLANFDAKVRGTSLVITGEGSLDSQTAEGKAPTGIAKRTKAVNPRALVVAVCGARADDLDDIYRSGIDIALPILRAPMNLDQALTPEETKANLICAGETVARIAMQRNR